MEEVNNKSGELHQILDPAAVKPRKLYALKITNNNNTISQIQQKVSTVHPHFLLNEVWWQKSTSTLYIRFKKPTKFIDAITPLKTCFGGNCPSYTWEFNGKLNQDNEDFQLLALNDTKPKECPFTNSDKESIQFIQNEIMKIANFTNFFNERLNTLEVQMKKIGDDVNSINRIFQSLSERVDAYSASPAATEGKLTPQRFEQLVTKPVGQKGGSLKKDNDKTNKASQVQTRSAKPSQPKSNGGESEETNGEVIHKQVKV